jgi:DNA-binding transcriptional ArsR family regulator
MELDGVFHALADETRRRLIDALSERDGQSLFELQVRMLELQTKPLTRQALSKHLRVLQKAGLLRVQWQSRSKLHFLQRAPLVEAWKLWLSRHVQPDGPPGGKSNNEDRHRERAGR